MDENSTHQLITPGRHSGNCFPEPPQLCSSSWTLHFPVPLLQYWQHLQPSIGQKCTLDPLGIHQGIFYRDLYFFQ